MYAMGLQTGPAASYISSAPRRQPGGSSRLVRECLGLGQRMQCGSSRPRKLSKNFQISAVSREKTNGDELTPKEFFESFLRSRQAGGDFVSRASDVLWKKEVLEIDDEKRSELREKLAELQKMKEVEDTGSFLKLTQAKNWSAGIEEVAPRNLNAAAEERARAADDRKRQSFLEYEASTVSYDIGAVARTIGIRSGDVKRTLEKTIRGSGMALSSPRLVVPAALFGLWAASTQVTGTKDFHLEVAPMMFGFFAYKAAALVQAYRDNKDLLVVFEKKTEGD
ncbi:hypothetical protein AXG93_3817s1260 [Marchantia polymorpha subsp. ruderalis]|uniref:Uncharacterized protein n=1 Tax=Marchantia polymorpha subsp. ruderalis TaxID=1480154 RepID=A0A176W1T0_MARPO|nr:hypothetical protein AXG93_3817s1260 [Marchantia polymorpha subsp. ruderalis]